MPRAPSTSWAPKPARASRTSVGTAVLPKRTRADARPAGGRGIGAGGRSATELVVRVAATRGPELLEIGTQGAGHRGTRVRGGEGHGSIVRRRRLPDNRASTPRDRRGMSGHVRVLTPVRRARGCGAPDAPAA